MKNYLILPVLFLLATTPVLAKGPSEAQQGQQTNTTSGSQNTVTNTSPTKKPIVSPTGNQAKNTNVVQTQNQGETTQLSVKTQESEQLNQAVDDSLTKVSDKVLELIDTVGAKGGIGQQVKEVAQEQVKTQQEIKSAFTQLNSQGAATKFFFGSDKKVVKSMEQKIDQNRLMIQDLEELKLQTKNTSDIQQLQETIDLMIYQNTSLQSKVDKENKSNGIFGWLTNLFSR
jgi:hypothetical protein